MCLRGLQKEFWESAVYQKRKYASAYPGRIRYYDVPLWMQWLPETKRYIYHLLTNNRFYHKPTYAALRAPLKRMRDYAEANGVLSISIPQLGCGLDQLEWPLVRDIIQQIFETSDVRITVYIRYPSRTVSNNDGSAIDQTPIQRPVISPTTFAKHRRLMNRYDLYASGYDEAAYHEIMI